MDIKHSNTKQPFKSIYPSLDDVSPPKEVEDSHTAERGSKPITEQPRESKSGKTMPARHARTPSAKKCGSSSTIEDCLEQFIRPEMIRGENSLCQACDLKARRIGRYCTGCCLGTNFAMGNSHCCSLHQALRCPDLICSLNPHCHVSVQWNAMCC